MNLFIHETKIKIIPYFRTNEFHLAHIRKSHDVIITNYELRKACGIASLRDATRVRLERRESASIITLELPPH